MRTRHRRHHGARRLAVLVAAALAASGTVAAPAPSAAAARPGTGSAVPAALPLAPPSPDLAGLPEVSIELAAVPVTGTAVERALDAYQSADAHLAAAQQRRTAIDRAIAGLGARRSRLEAALAGAEASAASAAARLDEVSAAIADLAVQRYLGGGSAARLDAALADEHPSINDQDQRAVLGDAALDVLLTERAAYQERLDAALHRVEAARAELAEVDATAGGLVEQRPAALEGELAASPTVAERRVDYEHARVLGTVAGVDFQLVALDAYHRAAAAMAEEAPACGLQWWALAGISRIEGRHGTYGGAALDARGDTTKRIIGIQLNGTNQTQVVPDTDGGALDGDPVFDRAVGPMQFIPGTWRRFASDGNGDGVASPFNLYDAALAAARYLCRASHGLTHDDGLRRAFLAYNQSLAYAESVLGWARRYQAEVTIPSPADGPD